MPGKIRVCHGHSELWEQDSLLYRAVRKNRKIWASDVIRADGFHPCVDREVSLHPFNAGAGSEAATKPSTPKGQKILISQDPQIP